MNVYVLFICDYTTRYPEAIPFRHIDAEHVAEELVTVFARVGVPREILKDQGSNFTSQLLQKVHNLLQVHAIRTSPYHRGKTDGLVELFNQTLKQMLCKAATEGGKDWDKLLSYLLFTYQEMPQASTGFMFIWSTGARSSGCSEGVLGGGQEKQQECHFLCCFGPREACQDVCTGGGKCTTEADKMI